MKVNRIFSFQSAPIKLAKRFMAPQHRQSVTVSWPDIKSRAGLVTKRNNHLYILDGRQQPHRGYIFTTEGTFVAAYSGDIRANHTATERTAEVTADEIADIHKEFGTLITGWWSEYCNVKVINWQLHLPKTSLSLSGGLRTLLQNLWAKRPAFLLNRSQRTELLE